MLMNIGIFKLHTTGKPLHKHSKFVQLNPNQLRLMTTYQVNITEKELVQSCLENDRLAQKNLYDKYRKAMFTLSYRITGDFEAANDVLQEGFVKVFKGLTSFRGESTLGAWIKTIIVRTAYSHLRKEKMFFEPVENIAQTATVDWGHYLDAEYLEKAILSLPEGYRTVFILVEDRPGSKR